MTTGPALGARPEGALRAWPHSEESGALFSDGRDRNWNLVERHRREPQPVTRGNRGINAGLATRLRGAAADAGGLSATVICQPAEGRTSGGPKRMPMRDKARNALRAGRGSRQRRDGCTAALRTGLATDLPARPCRRPL